MAKYLLLIDGTRNPFRQNPSLIHSLHCSTYKLFIPLQPSVVCAGFKQEVCTLKFKYCTFVPLTISMLLALFLHKINSEYSFTNDTRERTSSNLSPSCIMHHSHAHWWGVTSCSHRLSWHSLYLPSTDIANGGKSWAWSTLRSINSWTKPDLNGNRGTVTR